MACRIKNLTYDEVRDAYVNKTGLWENLEDLTVEEFTTKLDILKDLITVDEFENEKLPEKSYKNLSGKTSKYTITDSDGKKFIIPHRFTDVVQRKFEKIFGKDKAFETSSSPDNVIKAASGTTVHSILEQITHNLINNDSAFEKTNIKAISNEDIAKDYGVGIPVVSEAQRIVESQLEFFKEVQRKINPNGKITIRTEARITDPKYNSAGTGDLVVIFSDLSVGYIDYKTMSAKETSLDLNKEVADEDWISEYKYEDFSLQLDQVNKSLKSLGAKEVRFSRIAPIHLTNYLKPKNDKTPGRLAPKIRSIKGTGEYFKPIPVTIEKTGITALDKAISDLVDLRTNYHNRLSKESSKSSPKAEALRARIAILNKSIQSLVIDKDMTYMIGKYNTLINSVGKLDNKSLEEINELYDDVQVYLGIVGTADGFYRALGLSEEEYNKRITQVGKMLTRLHTLQNLLKEQMILKSLSSEEIEAAKHANQLNFVDKMFKTLSQIDHPVFQKFYKMYTKANDTTRKSVMSLEKTLKEKAKSLEDWGALNNYKGWDVYNLLINKKTGNLHSQLSKEFYDNLKKLQENKDKKGLTEILDLKANWEAIYNDKKQKYIVNHGLNESDAKDLRKLKRWEDENHPKTGNIVYTKYYGVYYTLKPEIYNNEKYVTPEYAFIKKHKPLLDYYNFWQESMKEARQLLGHFEDEQLIGGNFIPWIRKETMEMVFEGSVSFDQVKDKLSEMWNITPDETKYGEIIDKREKDLSTGKAKRQVPRFFIQPFQNSEGKIDSTMKSYDLNKSLYLFMTMAHNYNNLRQIEAQTNALQDILYDKEFGERIVTNNGSLVKNVAGRFEKTFGYSSEAAELFEKHVNYHLYGARIQDEPSRLSEALLTAKKYQQMKELAFAPLLITTNYIGQQANMFFEGSKGFFYNRKQMLDSVAEHKKALIPGTEEQVKWAGITYLFRVTGEKTDHNFVKDIRVSKALKWLNEDNLFFGYRNTDEHTSNLILFSMMKNYGIDENGNIRRLSLLPKDSKSLYDRVKVNKDSVEIDGLTEENYTQFRNTVMNVARNIKGSLSQEDMNAINYSLLGNLAMSFKNWLPALALERFDKLGYDATAEVIKRGKYIDLVGELGADYNKSMDKFLVSFAKRAGEFALDVATFGSLNMLKINENRAKALFQDYLSKNQHLLTQKTEKELYQEFLDYKRGNLKATAVEMAVIVYLLLGLAMLGNYWDDDSYQRRTVMRQLRRAARELSFFINPMAITETAGRNTVPIVGVMTDLQKLVSEVGDESRDALFGEDNTRDKIGIPYRLRPFIPGYRLTSTFEVFDEDEKRKY